MVTSVVVGWWGVLVVAFSLWFWWDVLRTRQRHRSPQVDRLRLVMEACPVDADVVQRQWAYWNEDCNLAVFLPDTYTLAECHELEHTVIRLLVCYDNNHHTRSMCKVWRHEDRRIAGGEDEAVHRVPREPSMGGSHAVV